MNFCFLGGYDPSYQRNTVIKKGLSVLGDDVSEYSSRPGVKVWLRYPMLCLRLTALRPSSGPGIPLKRMDYFFVPEFCQKDVPLARSLARLFSRPLVFDPLAARYETKILDWRRRPPSSFQAWWNYSIDVLSLRSADFVLADTAAHKDYYGRAYGIQARNIGIVPVGYDDTVFNPDRFPARCEETPFTVLFFGSFLPLHGVESVIEAARLVQRRDPSILFRFVGSGQTRARAEDLASEAGISNCRFDPWISHQKLPAAVAASDVCLGLFGRTGKARRVIPHKLYQSMGMGKAVITAKTPAVEEFFTSGEDVVLCDEPYGDSLAEAVLALKNNRARREKIAKSGRALVKKKFTPPILAALLKDLLKRRFEGA